ncbi:DUF416 family protein [Pedobacter sp.]
MNYKEFKEIIKFQINNLTDQKCIAFGLLICNRLLPEYQNFYDQNKWGNPDKLKEAIEFCESSKSNIITDNKILAVLIEQVESVIPDTENFGDYSGSCALYSSASVLELLEYFVDKDKSHIINISEYMTDTTDIKIRERNFEIANEEVGEHDDMINEWKLQIELTK